MDKRHVDAWDFEWWIAELAFWLCEMLLKQIRMGARAGRRSDVAAKAVLDRTHISSLLQDLQDIPQGEDVLERRNHVEAWIEQNRDRLRSLEKDVTTHLLEFLGVPSWDFCSLEKLREAKTLAGPHWIVPAWYLVFIEGYDRAQAVDVLQPDAIEENDVNMLVQKLIRLKQSSRTVGLHGKPASQREKSSDIGNVT